MTELNLQLENKDIEYMLDIGKIIDTNVESYKKEVEFDYIKRLMLKLEKTNTLKEKLEIYKFVYITLPYKKFVGFITGNKFKLFDALLFRERKIDARNSQFYF